MSDVFAGVGPSGDGDPRRRIVLAACIGGVVGGALQFLVQLPAAWRAAGGPRPSLDWRSRDVRRVVRAFGPLAAGRGAIQLSSYLDLWLASFLLAGAQSTLGFAQSLYLLPISLFAMSVAAAELPELSRELGSASPEDGVREAGERLRRAVSQVAFLALPAAFGYLALGPEIVEGLFGGASFGADDARLVSLTLAAYSLGLPASAVTRQVNTLFYAAGRTKTPARVAVERIFLSAAVGAAAMLWLDRFAVSAVFDVPEGDVPLYLGGAGLAVGASVGAWYELGRMRRSARRLWPSLRLSGSRIPAMVGVAAGLAALARLAAVLLAGWSATPKMAVLVAAFAGAYLLTARLLGWPELSAWMGSFRRTRP